MVDKSEGAFIEELDILRREMSLGISRKEAMNNFAERCDNTEIRTFVTAVIQSDEMGSSLKKVLEIQSDSIRDAHKQKVEEQAQKLPVKMLIPLVLFVFPTLFVVILGPAFINVTSNFGG